MSSRPSREFQKPLNTLFWGPLLGGAVAFLAYLHSNLGLACSWFLLGSLAGLLGNFWGTDEVKAYRKYQGYLKANNEESRLALLREGFAHYQHEALRVPLFKALYGRGLYREAFYVIEDYSLAHLENGERWELQSYHARTLWQLGQAEKSRSLLEKILKEAPRFAPALELAREIDDSLGKLKRSA